MISTTFSIQKAQISLLLNKIKSKKKKDESFKTVLNIDKNIAKSKRYKANTAK